MPTLVIEGREVRFPRGGTVLEAARRAGFEIPTFCHHPGLAIAGNCRMCLVEVKGNPKLQISCSLPAVEGMEVLISSPRAVEGRQAVIEFLLANHPLDCPICDKAGECALQDHAFDHGLLKSRFSGRKLHKAKVEDIGRHIVLDAERCIMCGRCVRFLNDVTGTGELGIFGRGNREEIGLAPGRRLDNAYSGNVVDLCPVGALTAKEFRFMSRSWYLERTPSVCPGCGRGCSVTLETNTSPVNKVGNRRLYRVRPRFNGQVNDYWLCDEGRFGANFVDENRMLKPVRRSGGMVETLDWEEALSTCVEALRTSEPRRTAVLLSSASSLEDLFLARAFAKRCLKGALVSADCPAGRAPAGDGFLVMEDKFPNTAGAALLGLKRGGPAWVRVLERAERGEIETLVVVGHDLERVFPSSRLDDVLHRVRNVIMLAQNANDTERRARLVLPVATFAERSGTWISAEGRLQRFSKAIEPAGEAVPEWRIWKDLLGRSGYPYLLGEVEQVFADLASREPALKGLTHASIGETGVMVKRAAGALAEAGRR